MLKDLIAIIEQRIFQGSSKTKINMQKQDYTKKEIQEQTTA